MIVNGTELLLAEPILNMETCKIESQGVSYGLGEAGYDIRLAQTVTFRPSGDNNEIWHTVVADTNHTGVTLLACAKGRFCLASAVEEFNMPDNLVGVVHDKSTWARQGLSVFNTVIEPGFKGGLTLELVYHGEEVLVIPAGAGIAQVLFHEILEPASYQGKYQNQSMNPEPARFTK